MWFYEKVTREEFEKRKDFVERVMISLGCEVFDIKLPYENKTTSISGDFTETHYSERPVFKFKDEYYRVDERLFREPFIVIEVGTLEELLNNTMEDADPFPYDLSDEETENEVKYLLRILPYPK
ncbi:MAG: hypothetical protein K2N72_03545 [Oscillospiraceae bacterium]|nr:hypothetical protein [Oscillospiraceae bacterium]